MKHWKQTLGVLTLATALGTEQTTLSAAPPATTATKSDEKVSLAYQPITGPPATLNVATAEARPRESKGAQALRQKLEQIVLPEVAFDSLPLSEVVNLLIQEAAKLDPARTGVNFLFGKNPVAILLPTIDPATGLPSTLAEPPDLPSVTIRVLPPLKNVRLIDVLDRHADAPTLDATGRDQLISDMHGDIDRNRE